MYMEKEQWQRLWYWRIYWWSVTGSAVVFIGTIVGVGFYIGNYEVVRVAVQDGSTQACFAASK